MARYNNKHGKLVEEQTEFDDTKYNKRNIYNEKGYATRKDYLEYIADDYGIDKYVVFSIADMLGPSEDFDGLIVMIEDGIAAGLC